MYYILRSLRDGSYYYGSAENVLQRLKQHNAGNARYSNGHRPYKVHYAEEDATRAEAAVRERFFKSVAGYRWLRAKGIIEQVTVGSPSRS